MCREPTPERVPYFLKMCYMETSTKSLNFPTELSRHNCPVLGQFCQEISQKFCHIIHCQPLASRMDMSSKADNGMFPSMRQFCQEISWIFSYRIDFARGNYVGTTPGTFFLNSVRKVPGHFPTESKKKFWRTVQPAQPASQPSQPAQPASTASQHSQHSTASTASKHSQHSQQAQPASTASTASKPAKDLNFILDVRAAHGK